MCILSKFEVAVGGFHENPKKKKKKKKLIILPKRDIVILSVTITQPPLKESIFVQVSF